jgi:F0F1-type ATP synthase membrane subunit a
VVGVPTAILLAAIMLLETLVAALQAYVFVLLASTFIGLMQEAHH